MLNSFQVALFLTIVITVFLCIIKHSINSAKVYIVLLFFMATAGFVYDVQGAFNFGVCKFENIALFIVLLLFTMYPWIIFDKWIGYNKRINISENGISVISRVCVVVIISSMFSIIYVIPYAIKSFILGAGEIRTYLADLKVLPETPLTTFAVAVGATSPLFVLLFFLTLLDDRLKKYQNWVFISCFTYIFTSMPFMARDGYVKLPIIFIINYLVFKNSLTSKSLKKIRKYGTVLLSISIGLILVYSISRFFTGKQDGYESLMLGTWGYLFQQPYVFDRTVELQDNWHTVSMRFPILHQIFGFGVDHEIKRIYDFETMFGTMLSEFYSISGFTSLFIATFTYVCYYAFSIKRLIAIKNITGLFLMFMVYLMIEVSGLFYFMYGGLSLNYLILVLSIIPFFVRKNILYCN